MYEGIRKFVELANTDPAFLEKLKAAVVSYDGEQTEEAVFQNVLTPVAAEYGITATYDEYKSYMEKISSKDTEMDADEIAQLAGGRTKGVGATVCFLAGVGIGGTEDDEDVRGYCVVAGFGDSAGACFIKGTTEKFL